MAEITLAPAAPWVAAAPFRAHLRHLVDATGLPWQVIVVAADVSLSLGDHLLHGRNGRPLKRIARPQAARLLGVTEASARAMSRAWVSSRPAERLVAHLVGRGWSAEAIADAAGVDRMTVQALAAGTAEHVPSLADARLRALLASLDRAAA